jgi:hypothetical protein
MAFWKKLLFVTAVGIVVSPDAGVAQATIDPQVLLERILAVDQQQREQITDLTLDAEYIEGESLDDGNFVEKIRLLKTVMILYRPDTALYREDYREYYLEGEKQSDEELQSEAADRMDKKAKRRAKDISWPMLTPFYPRHKTDYEIEYRGIAEELIEDHTCYHFQVQATREDEDLINGDYYFESTSFHLVRVDFSPARLVKKTMFKLKELNLSVAYRPTPEDHWVPYRFDIAGKGKAAFFFGVVFAGTEYYRNPKVNTGLTADLFEVNHEQ